MGPAVEILTTPCYVALPSVVRNSAQVTHAFVGSEGASIQKLELNSTATMKSHAQGRLLCDASALESHTLL